MQIDAKTNQQDKLSSIFYSVSVLLGHDQFSSFHSSIT